jgi:hypothetical protein
MLIVQHWLNLSRMLIGITNYNMDAQQITNVSTTWWITFTLTGTHHTLSLTHTGTHNKCVFFCMYCTHFIPTHLTTYTTIPNPKLTWGKRLIDAQVANLGLDKDAQMGYGRYMVREEGVRQPLRSLTKTHWVRDGWLSPRMAEARALRMMNAWWFNSQSTSLDSMALCADDYCTD